MQRLLSSLLLTVSLFTVVLAQETEPESPTLLERVESALSELAAVPAGEGTEEEVAARASLQALWKRAQVDLQSAAQSRSKEAEFRSLEREAPAQLAALKKIPSASSEPMPRDILDPTLQQLEQGEREAASVLQEAIKSEDALQAEPEKRIANRRQRSDSIAVAAAEIERLQSLSSELAKREGPTAEAERAGLKARLQSLEAKIDEYRAELSSYDARVELLLARREAAQQAVARARKRAEAWRSATAIKRRNEARDQEFEVDRESSILTRRFPSLQPIADQNETYIEMRSGTGEDGTGTGLLDRMERAQLELQASLATSEQIREQSKRMRWRAQVAQQSDIMGRLLRREYEKLEKVQTLEDELESVQRELGEHQYRELELSEESVELSRHLRNIDEYLRELGAVVENDPRPSEELQALRDAASTLLETQKALLSDLIPEIGATVSTLSELEAAKGDELKEVRSYREFVEERILWVRSVEGGLLPSVRDSLAAVTWALDPKAWMEGAQRTWSTLIRRPVPGLLLGLFALVLLSMRRKMRGELKVLGVAVTKFRTDRLFYTWVAGLLTAGLAAIAPLFLIWISRRITVVENQNLLFSSLARGLFAAALIWFPFSLVRHLSRKDGLALAHFRWPERSVNHLRRLSRVFAIPMALTTGLVAFFDASGIAAYQESLGRISFVVGMGLAVVLVLLLLREERGLLEAYFKRNPGNVIQKTRVLWFPVMVCLPAGLGLLALFGYYYSAMRLQLIVRGSLAFVGSLVLINAFLLRWLFATRRSLAVEQARQRAETRAEAAAKETPSDGRPKESVSAAIDEESVDIPAIDTQTKKIFRAALSTAFVLGLYFIWSGVLPALRGLDRIEIWPTIQVTSEATLSARANLEEASVSRSEKVRSTSIPGPLGALTMGAEPKNAELSTDSNQVAEHIITLADLILFILILILVIVAARNLPGLMELAVLQRLPLDAGARNAVTTIARYLIVIIGTTISFGFLGIGWAQMQWLAAALTFGLAFGLQEIFANFVSGLIILLERPIRLGDVVTVGGVEGAVSKIRMRATTITDWDMRELLVPNKEFITGQIVNWTLTEPTTRLVVPVGVAYGSDTAKVEKVLLALAKRCSFLSRDPKPHVLFKSFGASSLDFELRVFLPNRDVWVPARHWLNLEIDRTFRAAGIEIAFPQRDIHIRSGLPEQPAPETTPTPRQESSD